MAVPRSMVRYMVVLALCGKRRVLEAMTRYFSGDLSLAEAARVAGVPRGSMRNHVCRIVEKAKGRLRAERLFSSIARAVLEVVPAVVTGSTCAICGARSSNPCSHVMTRHREVVERWVERVLERLDRG